MMKNRLSDKSRKTESILIRLSPEELKLLHEVAARNKLKIATYTRATALKSAEKELKSA